MRGLWRFPLVCAELSLLPVQQPERSRVVILGELWRLNSSLAPRG